MTIVDLAEQLQAIGRQLQTTERRLSRLPAVLEFPPALRQLLTDPLARLTDLLQPFVSWPAPQPPPDELTPALAPSRRSPPAAQPSRDLQGGQPLPAAAACTGWGPQWSPDRREHTPALPIPSAAVDVPMPRWSTASAGLQTAPPPQGTRLTRERAALLSILQSSVAPTGEPSAVTGADGVLAPPTGTGAAAGAAHIPHRDTAAEPIVAAAQAREGGAPATPRLAATGNALWLSTAAAEQTAQRPGLQPGTGSAIQRSPERPVRADAAAENFLTVPSLALDHPYPLAPSTPNLDTLLHPPGGDATSGQEIVGPSQALTAVQLEQIMQALVERLELTLLRAYGTTGA